VKPASEQQIGDARLAELVWFPTSQQGSNFASFGIGASQKKLDIIVERDGAAVGDEGLA